MNRFVIGLFLGIFYLALAGFSSAGDGYVTGTTSGNQGFIIHLGPKGSVFGKTFFPICGNDDCSSEFALAVTGIPISPTRVGAVGLLGEFGSSLGGRSYYTRFDLSSSGGFSLLNTKRLTFPVSFKVESLPYWNSFRENFTLTSKLRIGFESPLNGTTVRSAIFNPTAGNFGFPLHNVINYPMGTNVLQGGVDFFGTKGYGTLYERILTNNTVDNYLWTRDTVNGLGMGPVQEIKLFSGPDSSTNFTIIGNSDLTPPLGASTPGGKAAAISMVPHRFLVYRTLKRSGSGSFSQIFLQVLNVTGSTLALAGPRKPLTLPVKTLLAGSESGQTIAVDPIGTFAIYTIFSPTCGKEILKFQGLDPVTGNKVGPPLVLMNCTDVASSSAGVYGIDVIRN